MGTPTDEYEVETNTALALAWLYDSGKVGENNFEVPWNWRLDYEHSSKRRYDDQQSTCGSNND